MLTESGISAPITTRRTHPGAWLIWTGLAGAAALATTNPFYLVPLFASAYAVHAAHRRSGPGARSFRLFALFGGAAVVTRTSLVFVIDDANASTVAAAAFEGLRVAVLLAVYGAFNSVVDPFRILRMAPRRFHEPALAAALALSLAPRTVDAVARVRDAQRMRGIHSGRWRSVVALVVPVLETGMEEALTLAESMDARGHGRGRRSRYRPEAWGWTATATAATAVLGAVLLIAAGITGRADFEVSPFPLAWPATSPWAVAGALAFGLPAFLPRAGEEA